LRPAFASRDFKI